MIKPVRLQLSRKRDAKFVSPNGLPIVICDRRGKWGNPYRMGDILKFPGGNVCITSASNLFYFRKYAETKRDEAQRELRGKNLACWCDLSKPCHVDIWLEIANNN